ncbi:uncharacterized protein I206_107809 [Kwoniella pini CBS 10737]|uniref:BRCT domain-containing protein n=1 Tax=Kwoniella pini CBS 10737 TaxID=1296096 RepID=A0A1B9HYD3_9TREE|nr:uncharacterized protein I206_06142 [Kwoniella pini CBS 10737]OCF48274.1 hypothetical protein I206_06142 [Kwoniella pini CBS 10737]
MKIISPTPSSAMDQSALRPVQRKRSSRIAAVKAKARTSEQLLTENQLSFEKSISSDSSNSTDSPNDDGNDFPEVGQEDDESEMGSGKEDENDGLLFNELGEKWLKPKEPFPWDEVEWYLDESIGVEMIAHVSKRIEKMQGTITDDIEVTDIILINPHPSHLSSERSKYLRKLGHVKNRLCIILPYTYLSKCYFSKKVEKTDKRQPIFLNDKGLGMKVTVTKLGEGEEGINKRKAIMIDLESHGAMIVPSSNDADICIVPPSHPYLKSPPKNTKYDNIKWYTSEWVENQIKAFENEFQAKLKSKTMTENSKSQRSRLKPISEWKGGLKPLKMNRTKPPSFSGGLGRNKTHLEGSQFIKQRSGIRTEFTPSDRDFLARWLAYNKPDNVGRTTKSLYLELESFRPSSPWYHTANRHPPSAWHEHFKRNRSKLGMDGKILEDQVDKYVDRGVNHTLRTRRERSEVEDGDSNPKRTGLELNNQDQTQENEAGLVEGFEENHGKKVNATGVVRRQGNKSKKQKLDGQVRKARKITIDYPQFTDEIIADQEEDSDNAEIGEDDDTSKQGRNEDSQVNDVINAQVRELNHGDSTSDSLRVDEVLGESSEASDELRNYSHREEVELNDAPAESSNGIVQGEANNAAKEGQVIDPDATSPRRSKRIRRE